MITADRLNEVLEYAPLSGVFRWKKTKGSKAVAGKEAGTVNAKGYRYIRIDQKTYLAHRLAWLWKTGAFPPNVIDHINGDRRDNRLENLRAAEQWQNLANSKRSAANKSGVKNVRWDKLNQKWCVEIGAGGRPHWVGRFKTKDEAIIAQAGAVQRLHGEFARSE